MTSKSLRIEELKLGVCYYPEHWSEELWEDDFRRMREMKLSVIRMAEFAWTILEPEEDKFDFRFFQRVMDLAHRYGLQVILGTPTATPPAWLTHKYPEVLNANKEGVLYRHGMRRQYNYSSPKYRQLCERIVRNMVAAYKDHPAVIGWQIDNELNAEKNVFYSEADHAAFRDWVKQRYNRLDNLNKAWGTVFWNQTYTDWDQIYLTRPTVQNSTNPHLALDEKRFISASVISFVQLQANVIKELAPHHWITTNGMFGHIDNHEMTEQALDFYSYDSYPLFSVAAPEDEERPLRDRLNSMYLSTARSISPNFCVMEQQTGPGGWVEWYIESGAPQPGQVRLWSYQSVLHGTDMLLYFRWRTATIGTEIYWHGINDYHNQPNRRVKEVAEVGAEFAKIGSLIAGTTFQANVAIIQDYDNSWDGEMDTWHGPLHGQSERAWYKQLQYRHIPTDILTMRTNTTLVDLAKYQVLIYPHPAVMTDETASLLTKYVEQGGKLFFGARTGYKNLNGHCYMRPFPGPVAELCGITVEDFTNFKGDKYAAALQWQDGRLPEQTKAVGFNEILRAEHPEVEIMAAYTSKYYKGKPALSRRSCGLGQVWYYGAAYSEPIVEAILDEIELVSPAAEWLTLPAEVEFGIRASATESYSFLLNYTDEPLTIHVQQAAIDIITGAQQENDVEIPPFGVMILARANR